MKESSIYIFIYLKILGRIIKTKISYAYFEFYDER